MISSDSVGVAKVTLTRFYLLSDMILFNLQGIVQQTKIGLLEFSGMLAIASDALTEARKPTWIVLKIRG